MSWGEDGISGHQAGSEGHLRAGVRMAFLGIKQVLRVSYELGSGWHSGASSRC
jgi:hypothetical protein